MDCLAHQNVLGEYPRHIWERNDTAVSGKDHKEFEKFRTILVTYVRDKIGKF